MDAGQPSVGEGWLMGAITAAILGGTSLRGGQGSIVGTVLGALLLAVLANGTVLMNVSGYWQRVIVGVRRAGRGPRRPAPPAQPVGAPGRRPPGAVLIPTTPTGSESPSMPDPQRFAEFLDSSRRGSPGSTMSRA